MSDDRPDTTPRRIGALLRKLRPHARNVLWSNGTTMMTSAFGVVTSVLLVRMAGQEVYGEYLFVVGVFEILSLLSIPGVRMVLFRSIAQGSDGVYHRATRFSGVWSLTGIPILLVVGLLIYCFKSKASGAALMISAAFFPVVTSLQTWIPFLKARASFKTLFFFNFTKFLLKSIILACILLLTRSVVLLVLVHVVVTAATNVVYYLITLAARRNDAIEEGWQRQSYALTIMDMSSLAFGRVDIVLLGILLPFEALAIYGIVMRIGTLFFQGLRSSIEGILPTLFRSATIRLGNFYKLFALTFVLPVVLYPTIRFPLELVYGPEGSGVVAYCQVYLLIIPVYFLNSIAACFMVKYQLNREINISRIVAIIAVLGLYVFLIPVYGIWGGVIASMLFYLILLIMNLAFLRLAQSRAVRTPARAAVAKTC